MDYADYEACLNTDTTGRYDVTPLFAERETFTTLVRDLIAPVDADCTHVVGIEALGFVLGGAIAHEVGLGFVPVRKAGRSPLPEDDVRRRDLVDYSGEEKTLELSRNLVAENTRVLVVDDWIETGAQMRAAVDLVETAGGVVEAISVLRAHRDERTADLFEKYDVFAIG